MPSFTRPTLVTITAPTCAGKNFLLASMLHSFGWTKIVSTTTREPRAGEIQGIDYDFISMDESLALERDGKFAELIEFRGIRYGVTHAEMDRKVGSGRLTGVVILEPQGLEAYTNLCNQNGWDMFSIFVSVPEQVRIDRLKERTDADIRELEDSDHGWNSRDAIRVQDQIARIQSTFADRLESIQGDERNWIVRRVWDAVVPGDDVAKALDMIRRGVQYRNEKIKTPAPYEHKI